MLSQSRMVRLAVLRAFGCRFYTVFPLSRHLPTSLTGAMENPLVLTWLQTCKYTQQCVICTSEINGVLPFTSIELLTSLELHTVKRVLRGPLEGVR